MAGEALLKTPALSATGGAQYDRGVTTPDIWSTKLNIHLYERTYLKEITNNNWESEIKGAGDTVYIREVPDIPIHRVVPGVPRKRDRVRYKSLPLKIDKTAGFDLEVDDVEALFNEMNARLIFHDDAPIDGNADGVEAHLGDHFDVAASDVVVSERLPEFGSKGRSGEVADDGFDAVGAVEDASSVPHIALGK